MHILLFSNVYKSNSGNGLSAFFISKCTLVKFLETVSQQKLLKTFHFNCSNLQILKTLVEYNNIIPSQGISQKKPQVKLIVLGIYFRPKLASEA